MYSCVWVSFFQILSNRKAGRHSSSTRGVLLVVMTRGDEREQPSTPSDGDQADGKQVLGCDTKKWVLGGNEHHTAGRAGLCESERETGNQQETGYGVLLAAMGSNSGRNHFQGSAGG